MNAIEKPRWNFVFISLILLFLAVRLLVLLSSGSHAFEAEELYRGAIARELIQGLKIPFWDYQADHYSGGSLWVGLAAVPFFVLFGPSMFSLKLAPILFALGTLTVLIHFLKKHFGKLSAVLAGLFFIFSPPSFTQLSLVAMGFHSESILFSALLLYFFYEFLFEKRALKTLFLFAFISGLGFWFTHITFITFLGCMISWFLLDQKSLWKWKNLKILMLGGFLGLLPWFAYNATHHFEGFGFFAKILLRFRSLPGEASSPRAFGFDLARLLQLTMESVPMSFGFGSFANLSGKTLCYIYFFGGVVLLIPFYLKIFQKKTPSKFLKRLFPLLLLPVLFIMVYWLSSVEITAVGNSNSFYLFFDDCRYFVPFHFFFFILLGIGMAHDKKNSLFFLTLLLLSTINLSTVLFREPWGRVLRYKGYSYMQLGAVRGHLWPEYFKDFDDYLKNIRQYQDPDRFFAFWTSLYGLQFEKNLKDPEKIKNLFLGTPKEYEPHLSEGLGYALGAQEGIRFSQKDPVLDLIPKPYHGLFYAGLVDANIYNEFDKLEIYLEYASSLSPEERSWFYFMLGQFCPFNRGKDGLDLILKRTHHETDQDLAQFFRGVGVRCMLNWLVDGFEFQQARMNLKFQIPPAYENDFFWGVGWGVRQQTAEDRLRGLDWLDKLPATGQSQALEGFIACEKMYHIPNS